MTPAQAARLLALPPTVRATLAGVPGPGWLVSRHIDGDLLVGPWPGLPTMFGALADEEYAWFPANPAAAVAAVLGCPIYTAHYRLYQADTTGDDHAAALSIIEAHVARSQS